MEPTDKAEPTEPTDSTDPTEPIDSTESFDHNDSSEPEEAQTVGLFGQFRHAAILPADRAVSGGCGRMVRVPGEDLPASGSLRGRGRPTAAHRMARTTGAPDRARNSGGLGYDDSAARTARTSACARGSAVTLLRKPFVT